MLPKELPTIPASEFRERLDRVRGMMELQRVGAIEFEPPIFGPSSAARFRKDMIISVDIPLFNTPWGGLRVEDGFRVTELGAERLDQTPYRIQK